MAVVCGGAAILFPLVVGARAVPSTSLCTCGFPGGLQSPDCLLFLAGRCFNEAPCIAIPPVEGYIMVLQPEEPRISLSGIHRFARAASEFEGSEGVFLFPELRIISTITREVEPEGDGPEDPTGNSRSARAGRCLASLDAPCCCGRTCPLSLWGFGRLCWEGF